MAIESAPFLLSSRAEVESIFSTDGINLRIDDDDDEVTDGTAGTNNDEQYLIDSLIEGSDEGYQLLLGRYPEATLPDSLWVRRRVSYIVCHLLSLRKGNPAQYCAMYERYLQAFEEVRTGRKFIPRLAPKADFAPTMSNLVVTHWHIAQKIRVSSMNSEGAEDQKQFPDEHFGFRGWWF